MDALRSHLKQGTKNPKFFKEIKIKTTYDEDCYKTYNEYYGDMDESKKVKKALFTEEQVKMLINTETKYPVDTDKVRIVCKYLDDNFLRAGIPVFGEDGYPSTMPIVVMKGTDGLPAKKMSDEQLFELLKDKFEKIYSDTKKVEKFLQQVMKDWYYKKITKQGMLSVNNF